MRRENFQGRRRLDLLVWSRATAGPFDSEWWNCVYYVCVVPQFDIGNFEGANANNLKV